MWLLDQRVALITGAGSGLGASTARLFAEHGARVVLADVGDERGEIVAKEIRERGGDARYVHADVRSEEDLGRAVSFAEDSFGKLDTVVANAGILGNASFLPTEEVTDEAWSEVLDVNLTGTFRTLRAAIPAVRRAGGGVFSVTSSTAGVFASLYRSAYAASKAGQIQLVRSLAVELAPDNIRVNAVCPGGMGTDIIASLGRPANTLTVERPDPTLKARLRKPGRDGALEVAMVHLFLCSDLAAYVNAEAIVVDGGVGIWNGN